MLNVFMHLLQLNFASMMNSSLGVVKSHFEMCSCSSVANHGQNMLSPALLMDPLIPLWVAGTEAINSFPTATAGIYPFKR